MLLVVRALNMFPLCLLANWLHRWQHQPRVIDGRGMVLLWFSGLRGAIAFAMALTITASNDETAALLKTSTLFTATFTTFVRMMWYIQAAGIGEKLVSTDWKCWIRCLTIQQGH